MTFFLFAFISLLVLAALTLDDNGPGGSSGVITAVVVIVVLILIIISLVVVLIIFFARRHFSTVKKHEPENLTLGKLLSHNIMLSTVVVYSWILYFRSMSLN